MNLRRVVRHLLAPPWIRRGMFPGRVLKVVQQEIRDSEQKHDGEIRFAVEAALDLVPVLRGQSPRERAIDVFSMLRVWDTEHNSGVLIYIQMVDRRAEIVADRGIAARVSQDDWDAVSRSMETAFRAGQYERGAVDAIRAITRLLATHFPPQGGNPNELPDRPVVL